MDLIFLLIIWICFGIASSMFMVSKGRSGCGGLLLGLLLGPVGLIIALATKKDEKALEMEKIKSGDNKKCPFCAEVVKKEAVVCKHCGRDLPKEEIEIEGECSKCGTPLKKGYAICEKCGHINI